MHHLNDRTPGQDHGSRHETVQTLHSHSTLIRLLEEIETHAAALTAHDAGYVDGHDATHDDGYDDDGQDAIVDVLLQFCVHFAEELHAHIAEEERGIFEMAKAAGLARRVDTLHAEHRELEQLVASLLALVGGLDPDALEAAELASLRQIVARLSEAFFRHSGHEHQVYDNLERSAAES